MRRTEQDMLMEIARLNSAGIDCITTSRRRLKRVAVRLVASGHIVAMDCVRVAPDGWRVHPERWTVGYELTELGRRWMNNTEPGPDGCEVEAT